MRPQSPAALLLDLDGVLIDSREAWFLVMNQVARQLHHPAITRLQLEASWGQSIGADTRAFYPGSDPDTVADLYARAFGTVLGRVQMMPGAGRLFATCQAAGLRTAVVTNTPPHLAAMLIKACGLAPTVVCAASGSLRPKPAPDLLLKACEDLAAPPQDSWFVGDTSNDRAAAAAANIAFIGYRCAGSRRAESLTEIARWLCSPMPR